MMPRAPSDDDADRLRRRIAQRAAEAVAGGSDSRRAVYRAARRMARGWVPEGDLPEREHVRTEVLRIIDPSGALRHLAGDRFDRIAALAAVLETVRQDSERHPEGDALEHSLQVFDLVHRERPFDEELLTAALIHDAGLAIDRRDPVAATIEAVGELVTPRTRWLVESLPAATAYAEGRLGHRARKRLEAHPDFLDVMLLADADRAGRQKGYPAPSLAEAVDVLRALDAEAGGDQPGGSDAVSDRDDGCPP